ncbi:bifunctional tetrahydrofolate synthase/dihydrofolate synthase [Planctobacterium marinum]|uniref:Dihydrofolate synthase/folylpolyglutamate synthase n=1 Tax=Planctobacterium marinum TaxID=1631968 RepID=A0AA48HJ72_9ALTE|nr:bifunctional protein FolC [Planctobacterium marinum]
MTITIRQPEDLQGWLQYLEAIHPAQIEMGLERVADVYDALQLSFTNSTVIMVAGTNGKGSTCRILERLAQASGLTTGVYSSPHISDYRERVRINNQMLSESAHCNAFKQVEQARGNTSLTYFEFGTLAALCLLAEAKPDVILLEVGLGGRLDAVNIVQPDVSVITTIDLDHQAWLGDTRELVGYEKAGIMRRDIPCVVGDLDIPDSVLQHAAATNANLFRRDEDFKVTEFESHWHFSASCNRGAFSLEALPKGNLPIQNAATALFTSRLLNWSLTDEQIRQVLQTTTLPGRMEAVSDDKRMLVDVAHNPQATAYLRKQLQNIPYRKLIFILGMLSDKDSRASLTVFKDLSATWLVAPLDCARSAQVEVLESSLADFGQEVVTCASIADAVTTAQNAATHPQDLIIGFGSFYTVAEIKQALTENS